MILPKMPVPGHGWLVQFKDPEGNILALWQPDRRDDDGPEPAEVAA